MPDRTQSLTHSLTHISYHSVQFSFCLTYTLTIIAINYKYQSLELQQRAGVWSELREGGESGKVVVMSLMCDLNYIVFQAVPECFGSNVSTVGLMLQENHHSLQIVKLI